MNDRTIATGARLLDRRGFFATGLTAGLGAVSLYRGGTALADGAPTAPGTRTQALPVRLFGKTGLRLPILAFGGSAMVTRWKPTYGPQLSFERRVVTFSHDSPESWVEYNERALGPAILAKQALEPQGRWEECRGELLALYRERNESPQGAFSASAEYLLTVAQMPA